MQLVLLSIDYTSAPVSLRERLAFTAETLPGALRRLQTIAGECMILSTCNRVMVTAVLDEGAPRQLAAFLAEWFGLPLAEVLAHARLFRSAAAARHILRLACGLESMVRGEYQIVSQLKDAMLAAHQVGTLGPLLNRLLHGALGASKQARSETAIDSGQRSVVAVAVREAETALGGLAGRRALLVGAGQTAALALTHLADRGVMQFVIANRTRARAETLAAPYSAQTIGLDDIGAALGDVDLVVCATQTVEPPVRAAMLAGRSADRQLILLDLAVPRNVEPAIGALGGVTLIDMDRLHAICSRHQAARDAALVAVERIIAEHLVGFEEWLAAQHAVPTIRALRERAENIRQCEIERTLGRCPGLSEQERDAIRAMSSAIINKLLHEPITRLKHTPSDDALLAARRLFAIEDAREAAQPRCPETCPIARQSYLSFAA